ncbi:hypothetical protein BDQ12DRAFT_763418 [Crucibulum laeve]|uniref:Uncharacterized protein n=1 Tax=Crucibulum laeve TaxID=68775 RepID=A0A5C3LNC2_9AGAR|nr:hypothetical protein BDQ12DRAFT_763418 [Crucibulum laeve]
MLDIFDPQEQSISDDGWGTSLYAPVTPLYAPVTDLLAKEETHIKQSPQSLVFENQDILALVFENFTIDFGSSIFKVNQRDLLNAALACIACTDPAMNTLWGNMDSFIPLLCLLPSCKVINDKYIISGAICEQDWVQFDAYARRIRSFTLKHDAKIASHVFIQLMEHHRSPLLPAL